MAFTLTTAEGSDFIDRLKIVKEMFDALSNKKEKVGFALIGNRRVGKSSILKEVKRKLTKTSVPCIYYSLWNRPEADVEEFSFKLTQLILEEYRSRLGLKYKIKNLISSPIEHIKEVLNDLNISVSLKDLIEINITRKEKLCSLDALEDVFKLCDKLENETGARIIIMLDEFPDIRNLKICKHKAGDKIFKSLRTIYENSQSVILTVAGSSKTMMENAVVDRASPFYRQFITKKILPLEKKYVKELIEKNISAPVGKDAIESIYELSFGIPFYVQFIGRQLLKKNKSINKEDIKVAFDEILTQEGHLLFAGEFDRLNLNEKSIVIEMSKGASAISILAKNLKKDKSHINAYLSYLEAKSVVFKEERGKYQLEDPVFACWIKKNYG